MMLVPENFSDEIVSFEINPTLFLGSWVPQNISPKRDLNAPPICS